MRALPGNALEAGPIRSRRDRSARPRQALEAIRGRRIGMVFQDPSTTLNPTLTLGRQLAEVLARHRGLDAEGRLAPRASRRCAGSSCASPALMHRYPHEAAGGEKQRVVHRHGLCLPARTHHLRRADDRARRHHRRARPRPVPPPARRDRRRRRSTSRTTSPWSRASPTGSPSSIAARIVRSTRPPTRSSPRRGPPTRACWSPPCRGPTRRLVARRAGAGTPLLALDGRRRPLRRGRGCSTGATVDARARRRASTCARREILGVVGESGSGKSSSPAP